MDDNQFVMEDPMIFKMPDSPSNLVLMCDGREAVIDFGGDEVTYSGDLPVDEAAKIFFDAVFSNFKR